MKKQNILWATALSVLALTSACKKDNAPEVVQPQNNSVKFSSTIAGQLTPNAINSAWEANDAIGVFMKKGAGLSNVISANKNYTTTGDGDFSPASTDQTLYFPEDGSTVDFIAYYPFKQSLPNNTYAVDLGNQNNQSNIDLLYANSATALSKTSPNANLSFAHQLAKIEFNVKNGDGVANLNGLEVNIGGLNTKADFDLATGTLTNPSAAAEVMAKTSTKTTGMLAEAIVLPVADASTAPIVFNLPGAKFKFALPAGSKFEKGKKYTFEIELKNVVSGTPVAVSMSAVITDWVSVPSGSYTVDQDQDVVTPPTGVEEVVYTETFGTGAATSRPKVSAYSGWANPTFTFSDSFGNADLRTISAYPDNIHIWLPAAKDASLKIEGITLTGYKTLKLKYDLAPNASSASSTTDVNVVTVKVNGVNISVPSRVLTNADNNKFSTVELTGITPAANNTIEFFAAASANNLGLRLDNVTIIGIK